MREDWTTLKKLIWLRGSLAGGAEPILKTIKGALLHITDALAKPAHELVAVLKPVQDLHGYDAPWPAGGGVNKLDTSNTTHSSYNIGNIPNTLQPSTTYTFGIWGTTSYKYKLYLGKSSGSTTAIVALNANYLASGESASFETPADMTEYDVAHTVIPVACYFHQCARHGDYHLHVVGIFSFRGHIVEGAAGIVVIPFTGVVQEGKGVEKTETAAAEGTANHRLGPGMLKLDAALRLMKAQHGAVAFHGIVFHPKIGYRPTLMNHQFHLTEISFLQQLGGGGNGYGAGGLVKLQHALHLRVLKLARLGTFSTV